MGTTWGQKSCLLKVGWDGRGNANEKQLCLEQGKNEGILAFLNKALKDFLKPPVQAFPLVGV